MLRLLYGDCTRVAASSPVIDVAFYHLRLRDYLTVQF